MNNDEHTKNNALNETIELCKKSLEEVDKDIQFLLKSQEQEMSVPPKQLIEFCLSILGNTPKEIDRKFEKLKEQQPSPESFERYYTTEDIKEYLEGQFYLEEIKLTLSFQEIKSQEPITSENAFPLIQKRKEKMETLKNGDIETFTKIHLEEKDIPPTYLCYKVFVKFWYKEEFRQTSQVIEETYLPVTQLPPTNYKDKIQSRIMNHFIEKYSLAKYSTWQTYKATIFIAEQPHCICNPHYLCFTLK